MQRPLHAIQINETVALRKLHENPKKVLDNARKGMLQDLMELSNFWPNNGAELLNLGILDVFFTHLDGASVPAQDAPTPNVRGSNRYNGPSTGLKGSPAIDRAWVSLAGLTKVGPMIFSPDPRTSVEKIEKTLSEGWEGLFKWCTFFYIARVAPVSVSGSSVGHTRNPAAVSPELRRTAMDLLSALFYSFSRSERLRSAIAKGPGTIEMATRLWVLEDDGPVPTSQAIPVGSAALDGLIRVPDGREAEKHAKFNETEEEKAERQDIEAVRQLTSINEMLDRVVQAAGGSARNVVKLSISRLKNVTSTPQIATPYSAIYLDLMSHLSRTANHELRMAYLSEGAIAMCTKLAIKLGTLLDKSLGDGAGHPGRARIGHSGQTSRFRQPELAPKDENLLGALVASLGYLSNTLESTDGFTWVTSALSSGLLQAWTAAAKFMKHMDPEDADMVISLLREVLPRYLVYRSVVISVKNQVARLRDSRAGNKKGSTKEGGGKANWDLGKRKGEGDELGTADWTLEARKVWRAFEKLALERYLVSFHMKITKGKAVTCDNAECQKTDTKNNFMKCSGCTNTLYCSRECQIVAWKEGGHKLVCKLKQQELAEGKYQTISKSDADYFHHLATRDARHNMPLLRRLARASHPTLSPTELVICIDYLQYPTKFSVHPLSEHEKHAPHIAKEASTNAEARNEELINRTKEHPGKYGLVQSKIANGQGMQLVLSLVPGIFWDDAGWTADSADRERAEEDSEDEETKPSDKGQMHDQDGAPFEDDFVDKRLDDVDFMQARLALNGFLKSLGQPAQF